MSVTLIIPLDEWSLSSIEEIKEIEERLADDCRWGALSSRESTTIIDLTG